MNVEQNGNFFDRSLRSFGHRDWDRQSARVTGGRGQLGVMVGR